MGIVLSAFEVVRGGVRLEVHRIVNPLIGPQARNAHNPAVGLADVGQPLSADVRGMLAPLTIPMLVYYQHALLAQSSSGRAFFEQEFEPTLVDLLGVPPRFRKEPLQALRFPSLRSGHGLGIG